MTCNRRACAGVFLSRACALLLILPALAACGCSGTTDNKDAKESKDPPKGDAQPGTHAGAQALLEKFLQPGADHAALTKPLRPTKEDYAAVFTDDFAKKAEASYTPAWNSGQLVVRPNPGQSQLLLKGISTEDLKKDAPAAGELPGGYRRIAKEFKDGVTIYRFKFVKPGEQSGMAYDGLIHVNGQWRIFPKPWRVLDPR